MRSGEAGITGSLRALGALAAAALVAVAAASAAGGRGAGSPRETASPAGGASGAAPGSADPPAPVVEEDEGSRKEGHAVKMHGAPPHSPRAALPQDRIDLPMLHFGNRPVVEVILDGKGPFPFILDTGAAGTVLDRGLAEELELPVVGEQHLGSPAGREPMIVPVVKIGVLDVGGAVARELDAPTMDLPSLLRAPGAPRGVLSARIFADGLLTLDYPGERILIERGGLAPADGAEIFQYGEGDHLPTLTITVAGNPIEAHLDSGSPSSVTLPGAWMEKLPLKAAPVEKGKARLVDAEISLHVATLDGSVTVGRFVLEDPELTFGDRFPVGNLGYEFLRRFEVTLDVENRRVRLHDPAEPAQADGSAGF